MTRKILCVDDELSIIEAYRRNLRDRFEVDAAQGGEQGLYAVAYRGPYAVVVSDLRMPGMDGIQFMAKVQEQAPDSVRVILTGQADLNAAIAAVNDGNVFRFLTKPCPLDMLVKTLEAALEQYDLITSKRVLLEKTLSGTIKVLTEVLSLVNPTAFSRAYSIRRSVRHMSVQLGLPNVWQFELAAMLSHIGCITVPPNILDTVYAGLALSGEEKEIFSSHPGVGRNLLAKIPRLESVAHMIGDQQKPFGSYTPPDPKPQDVVILGAQMLKAAIGFDQQMARGLSRQSALAEMRNQRDEYNPNLLTALENIEIYEVNKDAIMVRVHGLAIGMVADEDVRTTNGVLLLAKGQEITEPVIRRLQNFTRSIGVVEPFRVRIPRQIP